ncbi:MAG: hypothetical protein COA93_10765 [Alphaproteobacteria bacterium]|nr:MAG: hypothetical protein COA93_10765 [Alphaproteobacteria bacterium]
MVIGSFLLIGQSHPQSRHEPVEKQTSHSFTNQNSDWKKVKFPGIKATEFTMSKAGRIDLFMDQSSGLLFRPLTKAEQNCSSLEWQWKVDQNFPPVALSDKDKGDRPVAVHVWFPKGKGDKTNGLKNFVGRLLGYKIPGRVVSYVWGGTGLQGEVIENPHFEKKGYFIILRSGNFNNKSWVNEQVDFRRDYEKIFNAPAPMPTHVAISGDSDNSGAVARASVRKLKFSNREPSPKTPNPQKPNKKTC